MVDEDVDEFCKKFADIYSFKEDQQGRKICKFCRNYTHKMPKKNREELEKYLPERILENDFGNCKKVNKMVKKTGIEISYDIAVVNNGVCSMFRASILKSIFSRQ
jgi:phage tail tube protein FII